MEGTSVAGAGGKREETSKNLTLTPCMLHEVEKVCPTFFVGQTTLYFDTAFLPNNHKLQTK